MSSDTLRHFSDFEPLPPDLQKLCDEADREMREEYEDTLEEFVIGYCRRIRIIERGGSVPNEQN